MVSEGKECVERLSYLEGGIRYLAGSTRTPSRLGGPSASPSPRGAGAPDAIFFCIV